MLTAGGSKANPHWTSKKQDFVVLELEELMGMEELFNVVIMQMVNYVTQNLYLSQRESRE